MDRQTAKELLHIREWLNRVEEITAEGRGAYMNSAILQEAGDSLMMKLGEAAKRLAQMNVLAPEGVVWATAVANRNFIIHQYDQIDRNITWNTLTKSLPQWSRSLQPLFEKAREAARL